MTTEQVLELAKSDRVKSFYVYDFPRTDFTNGFCRVSFFYFNGTFSKKLKQISKKTYNELIKLGSPKLIIGK